MANRDLQGLCIHFIVIISSQNPLNGNSSIGTGVDVDIDDSPDSCTTGLYGVPKSVPISSFPYNETRIYVFGASEPTTWCVESCLFSCRAILSIHAANWERVDKASLTLNFLNPPWTSWSVPVNNVHFRSSRGSGPGERINSVFIACGP
jgi:hypothetical protein